MRILFFFAALMITTLSIEAQSTKTINVATSNISWRAEKVTGKHNGNVKFKSGNLVFKGDTLIGGELLVDASTIEVLDLQGKSKSNLENHLKSDDFFSAAKHPTANIKLTKVISRGMPGEYKITANITIKNFTKEIKFNATAKDGKGLATIKLDRTDFDIRYRSGSFIENLGDKTIYDDFDLDIALAY